MIGSPVLTDRSFREFMECMYGQCDQHTLKKQFRLVTRQYSEDMGNRLAGGRRLKELIAAHCEDPSANTLVLNGFVHNRLVTPTTIGEFLASRGGAVDRNQLIYHFIGAESESEVQQNSARYTNLIATAERVSNSLNRFFDESLLLTGSCLYVHTLFTITDCDFLRNRFNSLAAVFDPSTIRELQDYSSVAPDMRRLDEVLDTKYATEHNNHNSSLTSAVNSHMQRSLNELKKYAATKPLDVLNTNLSSDHKQILEKYLEDSKREYGCTFAEVVDLCLGSMDAADIPEFARVLSVTLTEMSGDSSCMHGAINRLLQSALPFSRAGIEKVWKPEEILAEIRKIPDVERSGDRVRALLTEMKLDEVRVNEYVACLGDLEENANESPVAVAVAVQTPTSASSAPRSVPTKATRDFKSSRF